MKTVILAAGFGSRLWPLSTSEKPKQFQPLINGVSLLTYTYNQLRKITPADELFIVVASGMQKLVRAELPELSTSQLIVVPERRGTLPHTVVALAAVATRDNEPILFKGVDLFQTDEAAYLESLSHAVHTYKGTAITLLCTPYKTFNTNDGYCITDTSGAIITLLEKPTQQALEKEIGSHAVYRGQMTYIATKQAMHAALDQITDEWAPILKDLLHQKLSAATKPDFLVLPVMDISSTLFQKSRALRVATIGGEAVDVGRYQELHMLGTKDAHGNVVIGNVVLSGECRNNLIINQSREPLV